MNIESMCGIPIGHQSNKYYRHLVAYLLTLIFWLICIWRKQTDTMSSVHYLIRNIILFRHKIHTLQNFRCQMFFMVVFKQYDGYIWDLIGWEGIF